MSIAVRQSRAQSSFSANPSLAFSSNVLLGSCLVVTFYINTSTPPVSVTDSLGNTYTRIGSAQSSNGGASFSYAYVCLSSVSGGANTISINSGGSNGDISGIFEITSSTALSVDQFLKGPFSTASFTTGTITPSTASSIVITHVQPTGNATCGVSSPFTSLPNGSFAQAAYLILTSSAATSASYTGCGNNNGFLLFDLSESGDNSKAHNADCVVSNTDDKAHSVDCYVNFNTVSKSFSADAYIAVFQKQHSADAFITNPTNGTVALTYVNLAGNILVKINPTNGYTRLAGTINAPQISYVGLLGTIKALNNRSGVNLAGRIKAKTIGPTAYVNLAGTISNPTYKSWSADAMISTPIRLYVSLAGTIVQKLQQTGPPVPTGAYPDSSYTKLRAVILNPAATKDSIQMPGQGYTTADDWYSSTDAAASYKPNSLFNLAGATLPAGGINLVVSAFTAGVNSFQTRTRTWLRRVDAAPNGIVINTQVNTHTLPNGAVITTTTVVTQNQDVTTTTITTQSSATPTRTSTVITEKTNGGQISTREIDTNTINGIVTNSEKKTVYSVPPTFDNPQPLKVTTLDGVIHYQFFTAINAEWAGGDQEGVTKTLNQTQVIPGQLNGQTTDQFGNPILSKVSSASVTTPDGKIITSTTTETGSSVAKDYGTIVTDTVSEFVGIQKTTTVKTQYPDGSVTLNVKTENSLTGESTETDTETVTDEFGQVTTTVTSTDTLVFPDPVTGLNRQQITKTVQVTKGGVTTTDTTVLTNNDFEDSIVNQKIKVYFIQEYTLTCVIDELNLFALSDLNITMQKNYTLLELFGQQLGNANLSWALRNKLINQFNNANASIVPIVLTALGKQYSVVFAQSASAFRAKYIPGTEPHVYELQMILQSRSDIVTGTFGF